MFTVPPALVVGSGVVDAAVVGDQLPLVLVGQVNDPAPAACAPVVDEEEQPTRPVAATIAATAATPSLSRRIRTFSTGAPLPRVDLHDAVDASR
jgi:hypothetical protein